MMFVYGLIDRENYIKLDYVVLIKGYFLYYNYYYQYREIFYDKKNIFCLFICVE